MGEGEVFCGGSELIAFWSQYHSNPLRPSCLAWKYKGGNTTILGLRCSNSDYSIAVLNGTKDNPNVIETGTVNFPKNYSKPLKLKWFIQEIDALIDKHNIKTIVMKGAEGIAQRGKAFVERIEVETIPYLSGGNKGLKNISKKVKSTIAKDLGLKGKAKYLDSKLDTSKIDGFDKLKTKVQEAILAAWSEVK